MSNRSKGSSIEVRAKKLLENDGYFVHRTLASAPLIIKGKFISTANNDLFGVFDLIAVRPGSPVRFIQVTTTEHVGDRCAKVVKVVERFPTTGCECRGGPGDPPCRVEVWGWVGGAKRRDKRFSAQTRFVRRQYFKQLIWCPVSENNAQQGWVEYTPADEGWQDHGGAPV